MAKARAADAAGVLLDELLLEIFARVPDVLDVIRCAGTCTRWFRLICCPEFLRRIGLLTTTESARRVSFLVGAFCHGEAVLFSAAEPMPKVCERPPRFFGLRTRPAGGATPTFTSLIPNDDGTFNYARPLVSRRGLLLLRIMPTPLDRGELHLAVCHPLIGERSTHLVPPPPLEVDRRDVVGDMTGYALLTTADHRVCGGGPAFRVLLTVFCSADQLVHAYSYSSATNSWSAPSKCSQTLGLAMCGPLAGVVTGEIVHWLYGDSTSFYTLDVCADATRVSLTKIPIQIERVQTGRGLARQQPPFPCIAGDGELSLVNKLNSGVLELWTKREQGDDDHNRESWVRSELMTKEAAKGILILSFAESRGAIVVKRHWRHGLFTLDLDTKKMEPVMRGEGSRFCREYDPFAGWTRNDRVLYEMDWSSYLLLLSAKSLHSTGNPKWVVGADAFIV